MNRYYTPIREEVLKTSSKNHPKGTGLNALKAALATANKEGKQPRLVI